MKKFSKTKKIGKLGALLLTIISLISIVAIAATFNFLVAVGTDDNVTVSEMYSVSTDGGTTWDKAEDFVIDFEPVTAAGNIENTEFMLRYDGNGETVYMVPMFTITNSDEDALTVTLKDSTATEVIGWDPLGVPGATETFTFEVEVSEYATAGVYTAKLQVTYV